MNKCLVSDVTRTGICVAFVMLDVALRHLGELFVDVMRDFVEPHDSRTDHAFHVYVRQHCKVRLLSRKSVYISDDHSIKVKIKSRFSNNTFSEKLNLRPPTRPILFKRYALAWDFHI